MYFLNDDLYRYFEQLRYRLIGPLLSPSAREENKERQNVIFSTLESRKFQSNFFFETSIISKLVFSVQF